MSNLDKNYMLKLDLVEKIKNDEMEFSLSDNDTSVFYITITRNEEKVDLKNAQVTFYVIKPDKRSYKSTDLIFDSSKELFYCNLTSEFKDETGQYVGQIVVYDSSTQEKIIVPSRIYYTVNSDILAEIMGLI